MVNAHSAKTVRQKIQLCTYEQENTVDHLH
jgi:hypothetical protein